MLKVTGAVYLFPARSWTAEKKFSIEIPNFQEKRLQPSCKKNFLLFHCLNDLFRPLIHWLADWFFSSFNWLSQSSNQSIESRIKSNIRKDWSINQSTGLSNSRLGQLPCQLGKFCQNSIILGDDVCVCDVGRKETSRAETQPHRPYAASGLENEEGDRRTQLSVGNAIDVPKIWETEATANHHL
jgi:hypothetical protein